MRYDKGPGLFDNLPEETEERPDLLAGLNPEQREAVEVKDGPVLILAGAGSGKTRVITFRIAHLIDAFGARPESILAVTFTNKAAGEMRERVEKLLSNRPRSGAPLISTFHSLCVRILRRDIEKLEQGYTRSFNIYDSDDQQRLIKGCMKDLGLDDKSLTPRYVQSAISGAKNRGEDPVSYTARAEFADPRREAVAKIFATYEEKLKSANALDFDDLLIRAVQLLRHSEEARRYYHNRFRHVLVDEFQDTNGIQYSLTRLIVEGDLALNIGRRPDDFWNGRSLCVVGDESQAIYGWRGSDFKIILNFEKDYPGTKTIKLEENYRSTRRILDAANRVISNNTQRFDKVLRANSQDGDKIRYAQLIDGESEARWVVSKIDEHLRRGSGIKAAVLYRTNAQSRLFEEACRRAGVKYNLVGGFSFYDRAEVKDVIAYLKLAVNPNDTIALQRVINTPARGIGKTTLDEIERRVRLSGLNHWETIGEIVETNALPARTVTALSSFRSIIKKLVDKAADRAEPVSEVVKAAVIDTGYELMLKNEDSEEAAARLLNLEELVNAAVESEERGETLRDFLDHAALVSDTDDIEDEAQVTLMTMHAAKGLEFPVVFIAGLEESLFPHSRVKNSESELEEERRLCYVAITRAEKNLYLTHAANRRVYGEELPAEPSRFLNEFPLELIEDLSGGSSWLGFANRDSTVENRHAVRALRQNDSSWQRPKRSSNYEGPKNNTADSVAEFFKRQGMNVDLTSFTKNEDKAETQSGGGSGGLKVGTRVRHEKYGVGLIIKREGDGENVKLTINFPGYGHKKVIEKYANLKKA